MDEQEGLRLVTSSPTYRPQSGPIIGNMHGKKARKSHDQSSESVTRFACVSSGALALLRR